jgi:hypothetical protein
VAITAIYKPVFKNIGKANFYWVTKIESIIHQKAVVLEKKLKSSSGRWRSSPDGCDVDRLISWSQTGWWAVVASATWAWLAGLSWLSWLTVLAWLAWWAWWSVLSGASGLSWVAWTAWWSTWSSWSWTSSVSWTAGWAWWSIALSAWASVWSWTAWLSVAAWWSWLSAWSTVSLASWVAWLSVAAWVAWLSAWSWWAWWSSWGGAWALRWEEGRRIWHRWAWWSWWSDVSWVSVDAVNAWATWLTGWSWCSALASAAAVGLTLGALTGVEHHAGVWGHNGGGGDTVRGWLVGSNLQVQHLLPHVAGAGLAEVQLQLHVRLEGLHVVEDEWEGDQAGGDGHGGQHDGEESHRPHRALLLLLLFHFG